MLGFGGGGFGFAGANVGTYGGKGFGYGGYGYGQSFSELEKIAKETERELKMQLESLTDWPELDRLSAVWRNTVAALTPMSAMGFFELRCSYSDFAGRWVLPRVSDHSCGSRPMCPVNAEVTKDALAVTWNELEAFAEAPLSVLGLQDWIVNVKKAGEMVDENLCFDVEDHPDAKSKVAQDMHRRLVRDMSDYAHKENSSLCTLCTFLQSSSALFAREGEPSSELEAAAGRLQELITALETQRKKDMMYVLSALPFVVKMVNDVPVESCVDEEERLRRLFMLRQVAGLECNVNLELLFCTVISSKSFEDLKRFNPFIENPEHVCHAVVASILHASRVGQANRCLIEAKELQAELNAFQARQCSTHPLPREVADERPKIEETISRLAHKAETLASLLGAKRHFVHKSEDKTLTYDPRFLLFEFTWNILLRKAQIDLVHEFLGSVRAGKPLVKQMLMGGGKTTVVGPLLTLMLADGNSLVVQMMPPALLEQTKITLRATFSSIIKKQVFVLNFDRSSQMTWSIVDKLVTATRNRGVVLATATSIKSIQLKLIEELDILRDSRRKHHPQMEHHVRALVRVMQLFSSGVLIMDEVDLLLHPLKSELNFPIGAKLPLDFTPERWNLAIHLIDAVFYVDRKRLSVGFQQSSRAYSILRELETVIEQGYSMRALQKSPHLVLLNEDWYKSDMLPVMAQWAHLWIEANNLSGLSSAEIMAYITRDTSMLEVQQVFRSSTLSDDGIVTDPTSRRQEDALKSELLKRLYDKASKTLDGKAFKMLNIATDWLHTFLPHCLSKIDRVSFGLLSMAEYEELARAEPHMPRSRFKLAIPFVGKDVPSRASEFAHPDIIIGLTILAYRYEGLRSVDFEQDIMTLLRASFEKEIGPFRLRKTSILHQAWVEAAGGVIKGTAKEVKHEEVRQIQTKDDDMVMVPLWLLKSSNDEQMSALFELLKLLPDTIHWFLEQIIFPTFMQHQAVKISSSGTDVGGDIIFSRRIGFSGTPSDLLPISLGNCGYEQGSDGKMIHTLTNPAVTSTLDSEVDWSVHGLLDQIINAQPHFNALIDTGALITGMTNLQVAEYIAHKSAWCDGVVFLDSRDEKRIYVKATRRVVKLAQCGIKKENRFAFYDQVHTTGMDIQHMLTAKAVLTLGKDMVFRDFAQGAFRMRGIGKGQQIAVLVIPEVQELMNRQLRKLPAFASSDYLSGSSSLRSMQALRLRDISAWLVLNAMKSERVQFDQLCIQNLSNVWRKNAWDELLSGHDHFKVKPEESGTFVLDLLGEAFVSAKGNVSRSAAIDDKYVAILMSPPPQTNLTDAIKTALESLNDLSVVWVPEGEVDTADQSKYEKEFSNFLHAAPILAVPPAHTQRIRKIFKFFSRDPGESQTPLLILVDKDGRTITRKGHVLFIVAEVVRQNKSLLDGNKTPYAEEQKVLHKGQSFLARQSIELESLKQLLSTESRALSHLTHSDIEEIVKFLGKAPLPQATGSIVQQAEDAYKRALEAAGALSAHDVECLRDLQNPPDTTVSVVECACIALGITPDFDIARQKILAFPFLVNSLQNYDSPTANVIKQLQRRCMPELPAHASNCAKVLHDWLQALLMLDTAKDEATLQHEKLSVSKIMKEVCLCVCDIFGIGDLDEDLVASLKLAEASLLEEQAERQQDPSTCSVDEEAIEKEMQALDDKQFYLDQFTSILSTDVDKLKPKVGPAKDQLEKALSDMSQECRGIKRVLEHPTLCLPAKLEGGPEHNLIQTSCMIISLMFAEERASTPAETCLCLFDFTSNETLWASTKPLITRVMEGSIIMEQIEQIHVLGQRLRGDNYQAGVGVPAGLESLQKTFPHSAKLVSATLEIMDCLDLVSELRQKSAQLMSMKEEHKQTTERLNQIRQVLFADTDFARVNVNAARRLRKDALDMQIKVSRSLAGLALSLCEDSEERARELMCKLPRAKRVLEVLNFPATAQGFASDLDLSNSQVRSIQARLRTPELKAAVEELQKQRAGPLENDRKKRMKVLDKKEKEDRKAEAQTEAAAKGENFNWPVASADLKITQSGILEFYQEHDSEDSSDASSEHGSDSGDSWEFSDEGIQLKKPNVDVHMHEGCGGVWVEMSAQTPLVLSGYALKSASNKPERDPRGWTLRGYDAEGHMHTIGEVTLDASPFTVETFKVGDKVEGRFRSGRWYCAVIAKCNDNGTYVIKWDDGDPSDTVKAADALRFRGAAAAPTDRCQWQYFSVNQSDWHACIRWNLEIHANCGDSHTQLRQIRLYKQRPADADKDAVTATAETKPAADHITVVADDFADPSLSYQPDCIESVSTLMSLPSSLGGILSAAEERLLRWVTAVSNVADARMQLAPCKDKCATLEKQLAAKKREHRRQCMDKLQLMRKVTESAGLDFDKDADWASFPWLHYKEQSDVEEALLQALGLRDFHALDTLLCQASAVGLIKQHSSICFQAQEMRDLLHSELAEEKYLSSHSGHGPCAGIPDLSAAQNQAAATGIIIEARPAMWRGSMDELPMSPTGEVMLKRETSRGQQVGIHELSLLPKGSLQREDSHLRFASLLRALDVFVEDVVTQVHDAAPLRPGFADVLVAMRDSFAEFLFKPKDMQMTEEILSLVSHSVGLEGVETEQCREQEQEKETEQEQEQEIEMERYVDMAYQRDGEESKRWAFCTLGDADAPQFYPAHSFHLHGRNPLAFSPDLKISVNHYDPKWIGDRRLKNAYVSLEWIPSVSALHSRSEASAALSEASKESLDKALRLLDINDDGSFEPAELVEVLRSAEDVNVSEDELDRLLNLPAESTDSVFGFPKSENVTSSSAREQRRTKLSLEDLKAVLTGGQYRKVESGRHYVLLSLAEAATIRCILHLRQGKAPIEGQDTAVALRCVCASDLLLDKSPNFVDASAYQRAVAHNSFCFFDSKTHYKPDDINILLREIPAEPLARRFFFTATVSCRRRLAKRWEQTPLAKLFTLQDQWSLLKQRAQAVRMREAIRARGLLLHDAFLKFDWDRNGFLSMGEMYAALDWLQLPALTPQDVIFFMRNAGCETMQLSYNDFISLLLPDEQDADAMLMPDEHITTADTDNQKAEAGDEANPHPAPMHKITRQESRVMPKYEDELRELFAQQVSSQRREEEAFEKLEARQSILAQEQLANENADSFGWMQTFHCSESKISNPHTTRSAVMYDFTKGEPGTQNGPPLCMEGRGRWQMVLEEGTVSYKGWEDNFVVLRVPFRKNGSGMHLNQYTVSMYVKLRHVDVEHAIGLIASQGWDAFSKPKDGENCEDALVYVKQWGGIGAFGSFGDRHFVQDKTWNTIQVVVDTLAGSIKTYCNAQPLSTVQSSKITKDGQFALRGRVALFFKMKGESPAHSIFYLRSCTVHSRCLTPSLVAQEHAMNLQLHLTDAIQRAPLVHRPLLLAHHAREPFTSIGSMVRTLSQMHEDCHDKASQLWELIQARDHVRLRLWMQELLATSGGGESFWQFAATFRQLTKAGHHKDEAVSPFGESLLHAAAFAGNLDMIVCLLQHGADVNCKGKHSSCTPLHSAAAGGHLPICRALLAEGAKVNSPSLSHKTALYIAASKGWYDIVKFLAENGSNPYTGGPTSTDTPMSLLRKVGDEHVRKLVAELDAMCELSTAARRQDGGAGAFDADDESDEDNEESCDGALGSQSDDDDDFQMITEATRDGKDDSSSDDGNVVDEDGPNGCPRATAVLTPSQEMAALYKIEDEEDDEADDDSVAFSDSGEGWESE